MSTQKQLAENYLHIYRGLVQEVSVAVHINYAEGHISLIDSNPANPSAVQAKQWKFGKRELEYMRGWQDILSAMKDAIEVAEKKLKAYQDQEMEEKVRLAEALANEEEKV